MLNNYKLTSDLWVFLWIEDTEVSSFKRVSEDYSGMKWSKIQSPNLLGKPLKKVKTCLYTKLNNYI